MARPITVSAILEETRGRGCNAVVTSAPFAHARRRLLSLLRAPASCRDFAQAGPAFCSYSGPLRVWFATPEANELITSSQDDFLLLSYLRANNGPDSTFWVADGLTNTLGWRRQRLAASRNSLIRRGYIKRLRGGNQYTGPALYRWLSTREEGVR